MANTTGRFNYLSVKPGIFDVIFKPIQGIVQITVAYGLTREDAVELMEELNHLIDDFREGLNCE